MEETVKTDESSDKLPDSPKEMNSFSGNTAFEVRFTDKEYSVQYDRGINQEVSACMMAREIIKFNKENLIASLEQAKGSHLDMVKDRLGKVASAEYILGKLIEQMLAEILMEKELSAESGSKEMSEILPTMPVMADLTADNSEKA